VAHNCPVCGCKCHCHGDIDDLVLDDDGYTALCECCDENDDPWEDDYYEETEEYEQWWEDEDEDYEPVYGLPHPSCSCSRSTDEYHGWECTITDGECMFLSPDSKQCAKEYGEGPDAEGNQ
jgi:hypothetical protein